MKLGWHIHTKNGKFNIWSTITDSYLIDQWVDEKYVKDVYIAWRLEDEEKRLKYAAEEMVKNAKESGFCGLSFMRCSPEVVEEILSFHEKQTKEEKE